MSLSALASKISGSDASALKNAANKVNGNIVVGEWGCATASGQSGGNDELVSYCQSQMESYQENAAGWIFWSGKYSGCSKGDGNGWCFIGVRPSTLIIPIMPLGRSLT